jgi:uncharacterized protein (TIGR02284 family)
VAQDINKLVDKLNHLIALDYDAVNAYETAIGRIASEQIREPLRRFQADHERHIRDLSAKVLELGQKPRNRPDGRGFFIRAFTAVTSLMGDRAALVAMRSNEQLTNHTYDKALEDPFWPPTLRDLIERNRDDERRHLRFIQDAIEASEPARLASRAGLSRGDQIQLARARQALPRRLAAQRVATVARALDMEQLERAAAAGVARAAAGAVGREPSVDVVGDAAIERPIATAEEVHDPARGGACHGPS